jgi:hypothetical protein
MEFHVKLSIVYGKISIINPHGLLLSIMSLYISLIYDLNDSNQLATSGVTCVQYVTLCYNCQRDFLSF